VCLGVIFEDPEVWLLDYIAHAKMSHIRTTRPHPLRIARPPSFPPFAREDLSKWTCACYCSTGLLTPPQALADYLRAPPPLILGPR